MGRVDLRGLERAMRKEIVRKTPRGVGERLLKPRTPRREEQTYTKTGRIGSQLESTDHQGIEGLGPLGRPPNRPTILEERLALCGPVRAETLTIRR